jgi:uncharacterized protein YegL
MTAGSGAARPVYIMLDVSGSTVRGGFAACRDQSIPALVDEASRHPGLLVAVLGYATEANTLVWLSDPADIELIPGVTPAGLSSLAAGLRLLAHTAREDMARLAADGIASLPPAALIVADGLPTDTPDDLLAARGLVDDSLADVGGLAAPPVFAAPAPTDRLAVAGLRLNFHPLDDATPASLTSSVLDAFARMLTGLVSPLTR